MPTAPVSPSEEDLPAYRDLLGRADTWFQRCREALRGNIPCGPGCRDCCLGLFDITPLDRDLLLEGMAGLDRTGRDDIRSRASAILDGLRAAFPRLGDDLAGWRTEEIDRLCTAAGPVPCPVLGSGGECRLYAHRPLLCRLQGLPLVDVSGEVLYAEACPRCAVRPEEIPPFDFRGLRREERRLLRRRSEGLLLVPQALAGETQKLAGGGFP